MLSQLQPQPLTAPIGVKSKPLRLLHIVENLNNQAVESWLLRVLRVAAVDHPHLHWTFFCVVGQEGKLDHTARALGAEVIYSRYEIGDKVRFLRALRRVMKEGNYDILHCHHDIMSAAYLLASAGLPFRKRIVQVHNTALGLPTPSRVKAELAREPMRQVCLRMADQIVGISKDALESLIGAQQRDAARHRIVHYAVDTDRFEAVRGAPDEFRKEVGLNPANKVLLFVGRIIDYKNPFFVLDILEQLTETNPETVAVFAGAGQCESELRAMVTQKGLEERVRLLGFRDDTHRLMLASDLLIWPSLEEPKEGLGLGIVEAQAAGLPILMSRSVPEEAIVVPELVEMLPLSAGAKAWAEAAINTLACRSNNREESLRMVAASSFSMPRAVSELIALYEG
jgi:glycosyltransferase involved in cell wall biosynthesis